MQAEVEHFVRCYVTAWRQSRFWRQIGHEQWAATMRVKARQFMRKARFRKAHQLEQPSVDSLCTSEERV